MAPDAAALRAWLAAWVAGTAAPGPVPPAWSASDAVAAAHNEGVVALVDGRWQLAARAANSTTPAQDAPPLPPPEWVKAFGAAARDATLVSMVIENETRRVLGLMGEADLPGLLLKGSALAHWAYAQPQWRACGDVDLLLPSREAAEQLSARLTAAGYARAQTSGELVAYELLCTRQVMPDWTLEVDVHWQLTNSPLFSGAFSFDELMADSLPLPKLAPNARGLGPVHALLHACVHRALNLSIGVDDKLKWLYDLIVLTDAFSPADWQRMQQLATDKQLAGVVLSGLEAAATMFGRTLPADRLAALRQAATAEPLDATRLADWRYMQRQTFVALPSLGLRLRWLWQRVFPSRDYLTYLYGEQTGYAGLMWQRFKRVLQRLGR